MSESPVKNKNPVFSSNNLCCSRSTPQQHLPMILDPVLISKDENLLPYWNPSCQEIQSNWWLPHQIEFQGQVVHSSSKLSNFTEEVLNFWKTEIKPKASTLQHLFHFSPLSVIPKAENEELLVTKKIRIFPKKESDMFDLLSLDRRSTNLAIEHFKNTEYSDQLDLTGLRKIIKSQVKTEFEGRVYRAEVVGEAVRNAFKTRRAIIKKRSQKQKCDYHWKSIRATKQGFVEQRLNRTFMLKWTTSEDLPDESFGRTTTITWQNGRWFINALVKLTLAYQTENQSLRVCAIDPGVRTFATLYSGDLALKYGDNFYATRVFPQLLELDKLYGKRQKFLNRIKNRECQYFRNVMKNYQSRIFKIKNFIEDTISDLHRKVAFDIVSKFDIILLPKFQTQDMASKTDRKIHNKTVRAMMGLRHYQFQQTLIWMCKKYGKRLIAVNEAFTSKTKSWNGKIDQNLGGKKVIDDGTIFVDRDINGARGILLRALSRWIQPNISPPAQCCVCCD